MNYVLVTAVLVFFVDQLSKRGVENLFANRQLNVGRLLQIRLRTSRKPYYLSGSARRAMIAVWMGGFTAAVILVTATETFDTRVALIALGGALGGAAGNLTDVLRSHAVRDFIDLRWWPTFNIADVAIVCGLAIALFPR